jgi:hypothetical protein
MPPAQARAIADRAVEWRETGKARMSSDHAEVRARVETMKTATAGLRIYGWASVVDDGARLVVDHDGDIIPPAELERAAAKALGAPLDVDHRKVEVGRISESMWLDPAKRLALGVPPEGPTGWWIGGEVTDAATIARVESGELRELSMRFRRRRVPLDVTAEKALNPTDVPGLAVLVDLEIADVSLVAEGAGKGVAIRETRKNKETAMTVDEIKAAIAALGPEDKASLMASLMPPTEAEDKMTPEQAKAREAMKALEAKLEEQAKISATLAAQIKRRDIADAVKAKIGEVPGASHDDLVSVLVALPEAQRTVVESIAKASSEAAKALQARQGLTAPGSGSIATFDDAYMAAKSKSPKATPDELAAMVAVDHPTLYAERFGRNGGR